MQLVHSSVLAAMGYDAPSRTLTLRFRGDGNTQGRTYRYTDVAPEIWHAFQAAPSKGTYLNEVFKPMDHPCTVLPPRR